MLKVENFKSQTRVSPDEATEKEGSARTMFTKENEEYVRQVCGQKVRLRNSMWNHVERKHSEQSREKMKMKYDEVCCSTSDAATARGNL